MKSLKPIPFLFLIAITVLLNSCSNEPIDPAIDISSSSIAGTYYMTAFNSSIPTDLNGDGSASTNQMNETNCFNGSFITLNTNNTFIANSKGLDIVNNGATSVIQCFDEGNFTGTWALSGNQLSITYIEGGIQYTDVATLSGNTIVSTVQNAEVVGTTSGGQPIYLTSNLQIIFTK